MAKPDPIAVRRRIAINVRRAREEHGWSQEVAAERIGCSVQALQRLERAVATFTTDFLTRVAGAYRLDVRDLFEPAGVWIPPVVGRPRRR